MEGRNKVVAASTRGSRQAAIDAQVTTGPLAQGFLNQNPDDLPRVQFNGRVLGHLTVHVKLQAVQPSFF